MMKVNRIIATLGLFNIAGAIGLLVWWFLMPIFLPIADSSAHFENLILDSSWVPVNSLGLISTILLTLGFSAFYLWDYKKYNRWGFYGLVIASVGLILFTSIQYYETLLWPAAAKVNPTLLGVNGALVSGDAGVVTGLVLSGVCLGVGYILFGISALRTSLFPKMPVWFLIVGAPVFGNGVAFPVRTIGLLLFCAGTIWLSVRILRNETTS